MNIESKVFPGQDRSASSSSDPSISRLRSVEYNSVYSTSIRSKRSLFAGQSLSLAAGREKQKVYPAFSALNGRTKGEEKRTERNFCSRTSVNRASVSVSCFARLVLSRPSVRKTIGNCPRRSYALPYALLALSPPGISETLRPSASETDFLSWPSVT